jgi:hypothetical protein
MNLQAAAKAYVLHVLDALNLTPGALAKGAGISGSTLTRALNDPKHKFTLSMKTIEKIAVFSKLNPAPFLEAKDSAELTTGYYHRKDVFLDPADEHVNALATKNTIFIGDVAAGKWREPALKDITDYGPLSLTSTFHKPEQCFACIVRDESATAIANHGDILFCVRYDPERLWLNRPYNNRRMTHPVIVERRARDGSKIELTARFMRQEGDRPDRWTLLSGASDDLTGDAKRPLMKPIILDNSMGNDEIKIIGTIEWVIRGDTQDAINYIMFDHP